VGDGGERAGDWELSVRKRLASGDEAALGEVYDQFASFVYGLALRVIGDPRAAEDVSQDVFVAIWERPEAFDPERGSLRTWLGTLAHRRAVDYVRREEARRRRTERDAARRASVPDVEEIERLAYALRGHQGDRDLLDVRDAGPAGRVAFGTAPARLLAADVDRKSVV